MKRPTPARGSDLLSRMANDNLAKQLSCSWGGGWSRRRLGADFQANGRAGQSFFNATGDSDAFTGSIPFPSDSTNITEVGGTTLTHRPGRRLCLGNCWNWG